MVMKRDTSLALRGHEYSLSKYYTLHSKLPFTLVLVS